MRCSSFTPAREPPIGGQDLRNFLNRPYLRADRIQQTIPLSQNVDNRSVNSLLDAALPRAFHPGQFLCQQDEPTTSLYLVTSDLVKFSAALSLGNGASLNWKQAGDCHRTESDVFAYGLGLERYVISITRLRDSFPITCLCSFVILGGEVSAMETNEILEILRFELKFLQDGGYGKSPHSPHRPTLPFEDSPTCLNFSDESRPHPCNECMLMRFVPTEKQDEQVPCRFIPLNEKGDTVDEFQRSRPQAQVETALRDWLRIEISRLEGQQSTA